MSNTYDLDYSLWAAYLAECEALDQKPDLSDYQVWLQECDLDRRQNWELES